MAAADDHVVHNRATWDVKAADYVVMGERAWAGDTPSWGIWSIPDTEVRALPDVDGRDCVELGCGTAYISAWLARRGARRVVGLDNSAAQLATARRLRAEHGLAVALVHGDAERAPLRSGSFDVAISEYGAAIWCDPYRWLPEAARLLRAGGRLVFLGNSTLAMLCADDFDAPAHTELQRPQRAMHRFAWPDDPGIEFHLSHGDMLRLLRATGFDVLDLIELYPAADAIDTGWASRPPSGPSSGPPKRSGSPPAGSELSAAGGRRRGAAM